MEDKNDIKGYALYMLKNILIILLTIAFLLVLIKLIIWELGMALAFCILTALLISVSEENGREKPRYKHLERIKEAFMVFIKD